MGFFYAINVAFNSLWLVPYGQGGATLPEAQVPLLPVPLAAHGRACSPSHPEAVRNRAKLYTIGFIYTHGNN